MNFFRKNKLSMGIRAAFEDADNSQGLSAEGQAESIAEVLMGGSSDAKEEKEAPAPAAELEEETEDTEADLEEEETPPEESNDDESEESEEEDDETWESVLGVDEGQIVLDEEGNFSGVNVKVNGESSKVAMKDLVMGYQNNQVNTQKSQALSEERKSFEAQAVQVATEFKSKLENVEQMADFLSNKLVGEYNNIDWDKLRAEDPGQYAAAKQDFAMQANELQEAQKAIAAEKETATKADAEKMLASRQTNLLAQKEKVLANNPTWSNPEVFSADMAKMKTFVSNQYGFEDKDFAMIEDARLFELIKDAKAFREGVQFAKKKIAKPVPKFQKSKGKSRKPASKLDKLTKAAKSAQGANKRDLESSAVAELLMGGE